MHVGVVRSAPALPVGERLATIAAGLRHIFAEHRPDVVAVERVFAQQNRSTVMGTAQASGVALLLAAENGLPAQTHTPSEVKAAITGYGSADKLQVQTMVARVLRLDTLPQPAMPRMPSRSPCATPGGGARRAGPAVRPGRSPLRSARGPMPSARRVADGSRPPCEPTGGAARVARTNVRICP